MNTERAWELAEAVATLTYELIRLETNAGHPAPTRRTAEDALALVKFGVELHALMETACNLSLKDFEQRKVARLEAAVKTITDRYKQLVVEFNGDPRGFPVKLNGLNASNSWDGTYGVG